MNSWIVSHLWLIPAVPFAASLIILSLSNARRKSAAALALFGQALALALSSLAFVPTLQLPGFRSGQNFPWFTFGEETLRLGFVLDPLAPVMLVRITLGGLCSFLFRVGAMGDGANFSRCFGYLVFVY